MKKAVLVLAIVLTASPAFAQLGGALGKLNKAKEQADKVKELTVSEKDERAIGEKVSAQMIETFGVFQDAAVTTYVALVGTVLAQASSRPNLDWQFIVLDTDGVNAFAAPGGIVHITRGALGLMKNEAELAGVLGHEITHVTQKHTVNSIRKSNVINFGAEQTGQGGMTQEILAEFAKRAYSDILNNRFDRGDEMESDRVGVVLANKVGYAPNGLGDVLGKIADRNKGQEEPNGMFASHPQIKDRMAKIAEIIRKDKLNATATVAARYSKYITFDAKPITEIATVAEGSRGLAGSGSDGDKKDAEAADKKDEKKKGGMLSGLKLTGGKQAQSSQTVASAGARGVNPDRDSVGGPTKTRVPVKLTAVEIAEFRAGIA